jgi:hypothetical protein
LTGLPKFDDLKSYGISAEVETHLWTLEIQRLKADAASEDAIKFSSDGILDRTDPKAFEDLSNLADQIICNFAIIDHDNTLHVLEHCRWMSTLAPAVRNFKDARTRLTTRFEQDEDKFKARRPKVLDSTEANQKVYFALVDYITSNVARLLVRSATSDYWNNHTLAILAKWAAKLKIISYNPTVYASLSLDAAEDLLARMTDSEDKDKMKVLKIRVTDAGTNKDEMDVESQGEADITGYYYQDHYILRSGLAFLVRHAAIALYASEKTGNSSNCFEMCTLVYETGLKRRLAVISNDRRGDVAATSDTTHVTSTYTAFRNLIQIVEHLKSTTTPPPRADALEQTTFRWQWAEDVEGSASKDGRFVTTRFDDVVSVTVPLALTDAHTGIVIGDMLDFATSNSEEEDPVMQFDRDHFTARFVVTTAAWADKQHKSRSPANAAQALDPDVLPVSGSPLNRTIRGKAIR